MVVTKLHPLISVVVCTYNRAGLLVNALENLCNQTLDKSLHEIIVVDNNSTDGTRAVIAGFMHYGNVHYCLEPQQGLSHARNHGWRAARGKYVGYVDDDVQVPEQWLAVAKDIIEHIAPAAFGGPSYAFYITPKPRWYKDCYGSHERGKKARVLNQMEGRNTISGHNAFFRRAVLQTLGGFDPRLGMTGRKIAYGEESALVSLIAVTMPDQILYYDPRLYVYHLVRGQKMTLHWIIRSQFAHGRYSYLTFRREALPPGGRLLLRHTVGTLIALAVDLACSVFYRDRRQYHFVENYLYERAFRHVYRLGVLYEQYRRLLSNPKSSLSRRYHDASSPQETQHHDTKERI
jgi:glycosyltransferase involved in cell wall biosynthesis